MLKKHCHWPSRITTPYRDKNVIRFLQTTITSKGNSKKSLEYQTQFNLLVSAQQNEALKARQINELEQHIQTAGLENQATTG